MREAPVFRRCTSGRCGARWKARDRQCPKCAGSSFSWAFVVDLEPPGAPRKQVRKGGYRTRQEAVDACHLLQERAAKGQYVDPSKLTVAEYLEPWIVQLPLTSHTRENTLDEWRSHIRNHLVPHLGKVRIQALGPQQIRAMYAQLRQDGHQVTGRGLSAKSVWNVHVCLRRALTDAVTDKLIVANPATGLMRRPDPEKDVDFWTSQQLAAFLDWVYATLDQQAQAFYRLAAQTGMRRGELLGLRWLNLDLDSENPHVTVIEQMARHRKVAPVKTRAGRRAIGLGPELVADLKAWRDAQAFERRAWADAYEDLGLVFTRENGTSHDPRVVTHRFQRHVGEARVKIIRLHDLRHTSAVIGLRELGEWPDEVSRRLGHTSVAFTLDTYGHLLPARNRTLADAFDRLLQERQGCHRDHSVTIGQPGGPA